MNGRTPGREEGLREGDFLSPRGTRPLVGRLPKINPDASSRWSEVWACQKVSPFEPHHTPGL